MVLAKIYSISPDHFASLCGEDFVDYNAVLPYQENQFSKDDSLLLRVNGNSPCLRSKSSSCDRIEFNVRCRYFTSEEIEKLEAKCNQEDLTHNEVTSAKHLHLITREDQLRKLGLFSGQIVTVDYIPTRLSRIILKATYDKNIIKDSSFLEQNVQHLKFDDEDCYVGKKTTKDVCFKGIEVNVDLEIVDCEPVSEGLVDQKTQWILLDASCHSHRAGKSLRNEYGNNKMTAEMCSVFDRKTHFRKQSLLLAGFASPLKELWSDSSLDQTVQLKIEVNYWSKLHCSFTNSFKNKWELDGNDTHCLYVSMETLTQLGVQNGSWVKAWVQEGSVCHITSDHEISQPENEHQHPPETSPQITEDKDCKKSSLKYDKQSSGELKGSSIPCHHAQVFAIHPSSKALDIYFPKEQQILVLSIEEYINKTRNTVHISPLLLFNLFHGDTSRSKYDKLYLNITTETRQSVLHNTSSAPSMPFAQDAHLSLINTPFSKPGDTFDGSLKRYFSKPRLLTVGDVLCVDFDASRDGVDCVMSDDWYRVHTIYFKVKRLVVGGKDEQSCLVDILNTTVYQSMSVHSFVPIGLHPINDHHSKDDYWTSTSPPGLSKPTRELIDIIKPYLKQHVNLMPAVLLTGHVGVGKATVVNAVARDLALCVMNINCYDLIGESVAATESRINNLFQKATSCRPCVLLLRNIHALVKDREGLEDEPRIANTLQQCIAALKDLMTWPVVVVATTSSTSPLSAQLYSCFLHEINMQTPNEDDRKDILEALANGVSVTHDVSFEVIAKRTAGLVLADLVALFTKAMNIAYERVCTESSEDEQGEVQSIGFTKKEDGKTICSKEKDDGKSQGGRNRDQRFHPEMNQSGNNPDERFHPDDNNEDQRFQSLENNHDQSFHSLHNIHDQRFHSEINQARNVYDQTFHLTINQGDFDAAIEILRAEHSDAIGAPKIPNVSWRDIGGLIDVKEELLDTIQLPLQHPELFASGLRRSGVLLYGPPGTGKTLLAKAVATECSLNFLSVKGPELINMYVGQSEENVRQIFSRAQSATPCVIFFDELDSLAPNRGRSGDSGGVMDRVVSQLLAELDGLHKSRDVFVIGATNRPDLLDPALLRPGRFDKLLYLGISEDHESQLKILKALTNKFNLDDDCDLGAISQHCPLNFTGADLYGLCSDAMLHAIKRVIAQYPDLNNEVTVNVKVKEEDFLEALQNISPSVPELELQRYKTIQQQLRT